MSDLGVRKKYVSMQHDIYRGMYSITVNYIFSLY